MMKGFLNWIFVATIAVALPSACDKKQEGRNPKTDLSIVGHPRILLLDGEEQQIQDLIALDGTWGKVHLTILKECNAILGKPKLERAMIGRRLLSTSRELLRRVFFLAYGYRMTGDERFLNKAKDEMLAASGFIDWNPSHFLDVAEMTTGMAIGYDWLFAGLSSDTRKVIRDAILYKGILPSKKSEYNGWLKSPNNWNQVCNTGMVYGALAIQEDYPELTNEIIDRALESVQLPMEEYGPDGGYPEGYGYWGYGTTYNVLLLSAVEKILGNDHGLALTPGFLETGDFLKHMVTPTGACFNWSDNTANTNIKTAMFWFAQRTNDPSILWSEKRFLDLDDFTSFKWINSLPAMMIWGKDISLSNITEPTERFWVGQGANPVAMMRSSWTDPNAVYLGFKAGSPSVNHGHMDVGSFVMEANGIRWAADLGMQNYESLESLGMKIFGKSQDAQRWTVFRMNTYSHNVLIIDNEQQRVDGYAKIDKYSDDGDFMYAISDISSVYNEQLKKAERGVGVVDGGYTVVRDELQTMDKPTKVRWNMLTHASVQLDDKGARLSDGGKMLYLKVQGPDNVQMKTWSTAPTNDYDAENPGTIMVGFECELPAKSSASLEVLLVPESELQSAHFTNKSLSEW